MFLNSLTHECLNLIITPLVLALIPLILPLLIIFRLMFSIFGRFFTENMAGKVVLITGASSGIGEHMAYEYAKKRAYLVIVARRKEQLMKVEGTARRLGSPDVLVVCADVSSVNDCKRFIEDAINHFGRLDHLVNNAGATNIRKFEDTTDIANFKSLMDVNFWGSVYPTFFAIPHLKRTKGKIFISSSTCALIHPPTVTFYTASKTASLGFFEALRVELAPSVTITIGFFGMIESEITMKGKIISENGQMSVNPEIMQLARQVLLIKGVGPAAKAIVDAICRGERYVTEPSWYRALHLFKFLCPEIADWCFNIVYKKLPDMNGEDSTCNASVLPLGTKPNK